MKAGHALCLTFETIAWVTARIDLLANSIAELNASLISAYMFESRDRINRKINHHFLTEPALFKLLLKVPLLAIITQMVRRTFALSAEIFVAIEASNSEFTKMKLCLF